jgi:3-isopropylmalate/(R)-2-methylmalate dehydratase small subunit
MRFDGRVWKFGDHIDTDVIIPARYLNVSDAKLLAQNLFADAYADFPNMITPGDIIVAGKNFGCGSSREHAPLAIKAAGISCVIAHSFARIFYRNAFNIGFPIIESPEAASELKQGEQIWVDLDGGRIGVKEGGRVYMTKPIPAFMQHLIESGGLVGYIRDKLNASRQSSA